MQSPPLLRYIVPPRSKYSPQHHVLKHPQLLHKIKQYETNRYQLEIFSQSI